MFAFYDFETTGTSPAFDQPLQFAAILVNEDFEELDRIDTRCRLVPHVLPAPWALAVTGVTPDQLEDPGLPTLFDFTQQLANIIQMWGPATWVGYNTIAFDEEVMRQALYQNLHPDFYLTQKAGNDRMDIMKLVYAVWELANDALTWPTNDKNQPVFKLDQLAPANGFEHENAHDALADVEATIFIAQLIRERAPKVWSQALRNRSSARVNELLEAGQPLQLIERFGAAPPRSYLGAFAGRNPKLNSRVGFLDLDLVDPKELDDGDDDLLLTAVSKSPKLVRSLAVNKFPSIYAAHEVSDEAKDRAQNLARMKALHARIGEAMEARFADAPEPEHVEEMIYGGFFSQSDRQVLSRVRFASWAERQSLLAEVEDHRIKTLGHRLLYAYAPDLLTGQFRDKTKEAIRTRWGADDAPWTTFEDVEKQLAEISEQGALPATAIADLRSFYQAKQAF